MVEIKPTDSYCVQLEKRIENQKQSIERLHKQLDDMVDFESVVRSKICYYSNLKKKHEKYENRCGVKEFNYKLEAMEDLLRHIVCDD